MVEVPSVDWAALRQAYGPAANIPALLERAATDTRGGHVPGSPWFDLWSALCHQGDTYTASYAAVPFLVRLAERISDRFLYDPLLLAASIELSRLEGNGPPLPPDVAPTYRAALERGLQLATDALDNAPPDTDARRALAGCVAAFHGDVLTARSILDNEQDSSA